MTTPRSSPSKSKNKSVQKVKLALWTLFICFQFFVQKNVIIDLSIEHPPQNFIVGFEIPHNPHQFGNGGLKGHIVCLNQIKIPLDFLANLINGHVAPFFGNLRNHDHIFSFVRPFFISL